MEEAIKYIHDEEVHNLKDPEIIVPILVKVLKPKSVVDVGCGIGTFLHVFEKEGITDILGLDGNWVDREKLSKYIGWDKFQEIDLENEITINKKYDLAICLEVFEHIDDAFADIAVKSLTNLSDIIVFSAAIPGQIGQNHVNEQWKGYWEAKFQKNNYTFHDVFRPVFWNHVNLAWWYKQNLFLVTNNNTSVDISGFEKLIDKDINDYVHPDLFSGLCYVLNSTKDELNSTKDELNFKKEELCFIQNKLSLIQNGKYPITFYIKLMCKWLLKFIKK